MEIQSKYFGAIDIQQETIIEMIQPIYGFETLKRFTLISDQEIGTDLLWFQSLDQAEICFMVANPNAFVKDLKIELNNDDINSVEAKELDDIDVLSIVSLGETFELSTLNLKSPILLNSKNNKGAQVILNQDLPFRANLV
ncbi:MAG TPA: flagellar assembly protein FliW [Erysipelotrichaceae bacterium]|nr:flagellar assembly protein FliW [Erysipelotrichaceae bacterium]